MTLLLTKPTRTDTTWTYLGEGSEAHLPNIPSQGHVPLDWWSPRMAAKRTSRIYPAVTAALFSILVLSALVPLNIRGFACGFSKSTSFRESGGEGEDGSSYWVGYIPGRLMLTSEQFDSAYPNELPAGTPPETSGHTEWFCREEKAVQTSESWPDPTTYRTMWGFAIMTEPVEMSSHSREHFRALILPPWLALASGMVPTGILVFWLIRRRQSKLPGQCATCGYDLRGTPQRCPECGTIAPVAVARE
jgi:hypothetical protein